jgi:O-antigen/teichoic acid export membrane protein
VVVLNAVWLRRFFRIDLRTNRRRLTGMMKQSVAFWAFGVFGMVYLWIDAIMLSLMTRSEVVGWYGAPTRLFQTLMFIPVLLSTAWLPRLVAAFEEGPGKLLTTARRPIELVLVLSAPICAGTAMIAAPLIHGLYGDAYAPAVGVLVALGLCIPPMYVNIMLSQVLLASKRQMSWTCVMAGAAIVNPLFNFVLIRVTEDRYGNGAIGAAISLLLTELLIVGCGFAMVGRNVFDRETTRRCGLAVGASAAMWGVAYATKPLGTPESLLAGIATFLVLVVSLRIATPEEIAFVRSGAARLRRRLPLGR